MTSRPRRAVTACTRASSPDELDAWEAAARAAGKTLSRWLRDVANAAARDRRELARVVDDLARELHERRTRRSA